MHQALEARVRIVQSPANHWVKQLRAAVTRPPSFAAAARGALIAIEGFHLLTEALRAGLAPAAIFLSEQRRADALARLEIALTGRLAADTHILCLPAGLFAAVTETEAPQGVAALFPAPLQQEGFKILTSSALPPLVLVLAGLQDAGNVGTLLRSAAAFHATCALLLPGTASPWSGKSLRAAAGASFHLPLFAVASAEEAGNLLRRDGVCSYAALATSARPACRCDLKKASAIWIGNEGSGLTEAQLAACEEGITVPMPGQIESLNAAIAGSLVLYEASRQRA